MRHNSILQNDKASLPSLWLKSTIYGDDFFSHSSPYEEGKTLTLSVTEGVPLYKHAIKLQILRYIQPSTLSCVMEVNVLAVSGSTKHAKHSILKLYDWRFATQLRYVHRVDSVS